MTEALAGKRILVIEDEYFIASDIKRALQERGAEVVGPSGSVDVGLELIAGGTLDAAVLDVNLEGATSFPIADSLGGQAVPYLFLTGYDGWSLPERYRSAPRIAKPFTVQGVIDAVSLLLVPEKRNESRATR